MKLSQAIDEYLLDHQLSGHSPATVRYYRQNLVWFLDFLGDSDMAAVTLSRAREYVLSLRERNISSVSLQTYVRALRGFLAWCYAEGRTPENIPQKLKLPKAVRKAVDVLTDAECERLLSCIDTRKFLGLRDMAAVLLMLDSGMRVSEVLRLEYGKIHLEAGYLIALGKGGRERFVPLGLHTQKCLLRYLSRLPPMSPEGRIVVKEQLTPANYTTLRDLFGRLKKRSGIPRLRPHLLRHTFATRYLALGGDVYRLQAILGHTPLEMTKRYTHLTPAETTVSFRRFSPVDNLKKSPKNGL